MRYFLFILLLTATCFGQSTNISVVSAEKLNIVYRGVENPIHIAVPGAKSFTATAPGLEKVDDNGNYILTPGAGSEVKIIIAAVKDDNTTFLESKIFRIKNIASVTGMLNGFHVSTIEKLSKDEIINAVIGLGVEDFLFDYEFHITQFTISFPENKYLKPIQVQGNKMDDQAIRIINELKAGDLIIIGDIKHDRTSLIGLGKTTPIAIEIKE